MFSSNSNNDTLTTTAPTYFGNLELSYSILCVVLATQQFHTVVTKANRGIFLLRPIWCGKILQVRLFYVIKCKWFDISFYKKNRNSAENITDLCFITRIQAKSQKASAYCEVLALKDPTFKRYASGGAR